MKNYFKKNKVSFIVTSAALVSAVASAAYAIWQKKHMEDKILEVKVNTMLAFNRVREQHIFPHPDKSDFEKMNGKSCTGIAYQIDINTYSDCDFGNFSRECASFILNGLAENMKDGETLSEYFKRKRKED